MNLRSLLFLSLLCAVACFSLGFYLESEASPPPLSHEVFASVDDFINLDQWQTMESVSPKKVVLAERALAQRQENPGDSYKLPTMGKHFWTRRGWAQRVTCKDGPRFAKPLKSRMTSRYGRRSNPFGKYTSIHSGIDYRGPVGMPIQAAADGIVSLARVKGRYGKAVVITHKNGFTTLYGHLSDYAVKEGDRIVTGQTLGFVGRTGRVTGPHLHFEVRCYKVPVDPLVHMRKKGRKALVSVLRRNYNKPSGQRYVSQKRKTLRRRQRAALGAASLKEMRSGAF